MDRYICGVCATIYDPEIGDIEDGIQAMTDFEQLPDGWSCPVCGSSKAKFKLLSQEEYEKIMIIENQE